MVLKLNVPWSANHLLVDYNQLNQVIGQIQGSGSRHVGQHQGDVLVSDYFGPTNAVSDVSRYRISTEPCCERHRNRCRISSDRYVIPHSDHDACEVFLGDILRPQVQQQTGSIVLLLESPHKHEYTDHDVAAPKAPACGATGKNIRQCLSTVLLHIQQAETGLIEPNCNVVISNPIPFQTSLYTIHREPVKERKWKRLRDSVWRTLWCEDHIRHGFLDRLSEYHPKVIINACTSKLKPHVRSAVEEWRSQREQVPRLYEIAHPAGWRNLRPERVDSQALPNAG